ncbi:hypothetical protein CYMTET_50993 [Cymbomonas tetramitiformis]|uniref:Nucleotide-diphospho-sugar transferase domain-containing protein n=1 Tax=Cymbomonas tetramitiformis TaxID=36881 RepID=A0AAE0BN47_9CHLO|nr:hypothetical protein CYMTET_50993 [Cymbomonas tetramitiformis]
MGQLLGPQVALPAFAPPVGPLLNPSRFARPSFMADCTTSFLPALSKLVVSTCGVIGHEHNTGMLFMRSRNATIELTKEWQVRALETRDGHDQTEFNRILKGLYFPGVPGKNPTYSYMPWPYMPIYLDKPEAGPRWTSRDDMRHIPHNGQLKPHSNLTDEIWHTIRSHKENHIRDAYWMWHGRLKVGNLPMAEFLNGHMFFTRRVQEYSGVKPIAVHLTYQFGDTADYVYGKRQRLRELGMWLMEEDKYFTEGSFLSIVDDHEGIDPIIEPYAKIASFCKESDSVKDKCWHPQELSAADKSARSISDRDPASLMDPCKPHLEVQGWMRGVLRNALVLHKKTSRTFILPQFQCYCERHWWMLEDGRIPAGAKQMPMPYKCPMDHIFEPAEWYNHKVDFREPAFLKDARVPEEIRSSKLRVLLELPPGREPVISADVVNLANQSTFEQIMDAIDKHQAQHGHRRIVEMKAVHLRDHVSTCISTTQREVDHFNMMCTQILDGRLVEFCSRDRNYLIGEVGPPLEAQGKDSKEGMNCSYPGKWPVTSNPVMWNKHITAENRQAWIGPLLKFCPSAS